MGVLLLGVSYFIHLFGVELEEVGDDFGFGRVGHEAVGGNALAARCTSGGGRLAPPFRRQDGGFPSQCRRCIHPFRAVISRCGSMIYTFYMFYMAKNKS